MRTAVRVDENPALDAAIVLANSLRLPLLVYHALSEKYPYASDRHHTFILQGARDVQLALSDKNLSYAFHLERPGHRGPHLQTLSERAAVVVTEEMPVAPLSRWTRQLSRSVETPVIAVDTACVVPMQLVGRAYERAFAFRKATKRLYQERLTRPPESYLDSAPAKATTDLPFEPVDLQSANLAELVAQCEIDHLVGPVPHTDGGSRAGYRRWQDFQETKLSRYARTRNDPLREGVSRLSPYLHYGMISPQRIAREAAEIDTQGAEKFLDELLIWRELAYAFCFYRPDHDRVAALPDWAIETLKQHERDARPALFSWETLARGCTQDVLWDAAQKSLLIHGELHNNVRMTWGKALLNWTENAKHALATMIDLNHRYALDGRDPASYGGILWCLGQFDRPFPPARPIVGTVRDRSTTQHAERLDAKAYREHTTRPLHDPTPSVAVIGAGISGLMCARTLQDHGIAVTVFEKSRGPGGRMSTRLAESNLEFDHGAQYFTARDQRFKRYVRSWARDGVVSPWEGRIVTLRNGEVVDEKSGTQRFVATPGMNAIGKHLARELNLQVNTKVEAVRRQQDHCQLIGEDDTALGDFDAVVVSAPALQTASLLAEFPTFTEQASQTPMSGCWAVMMALEQPLNLKFDAAFVHESALSWIACNSSKPGRSAMPESWVLHASPEWSEANLEGQPDAVVAELLAEFWDAVGVAEQQTIHAAAHRWRYALPTDPINARYLFDADLRIGACGDWCGGPRVEGAFLSGSAMAGRLLGEFSQQTAANTNPVEQQSLF